MPITMAIEIATIETFIGVAAELVRTQPVFRRGRQQARVDINFVGIVTREPGRKHRQKTNSEHDHQPEHAERIASQFPPRGGDHAVGTK
jgi:hypothetical protein